MPQGAHRLRLDGHVDRLRPHPGDLPGQEGGIEMRRVAVLMLLAMAGARALAQEEFDPAKVNRWIVSLSEDPSQESEVGELHAYLKKHDKLALVYAKFEESFDRRPKDAKIRY